MSQLIEVKSGSPYEERASYSRAVALDNWIFVSNTAGRDPVSQQIPADFTEQALQVFRNVEATLRAVNAGLADVVSAKVYLQDANDIPAALDILGSRFRGIDPAMTLICPPLGSALYRIEIEVTAYRGAGGLEPTLRRL